MRDIKTEYLISLKYYVAIKKTMTARYLFISLEILLLITFILF